MRQVSRTCQPAPAGRRRRGQPRRQFVDDMMDMVGLGALPRPVDCVPRAQAVVMPSAAAGARFSRHVLDHERPARLDAVALDHHPS